jgi:hypothetical protein
MGRRAIKMVKPDLRTSVLILLILLPCISFGQRAGGTVAVDTRTTKGEEIPYVCVTVVPEGGNPIFHKSDRRGRVRVGNLPPGKYRVIAKAEGYVAEKKEITINDGVAAVQFDLQPRVQR